MGKKVPKELNYDTDDYQKIEIPVTIEGKKYVLCEASGAAAVAYRNKVMECLKPAADGKVSTLRGLASVEPYLVSLCLFTTNEEGKRSPVPETQVKRWSSRIQKDLFSNARDISDLIEVEPTLKEQLVKALSRDDTPVTIDVMRDFVATLDEDDFEELQAALKPTAEELAKNEPEDTTVG